MKKTLGLLVFLGLFVTPALAQKITIDYAHDFDFEKIKTFQFVEADDKSSDTLMHGRIKEAIFNELDGLEQVDSDPDLYVTYHLTSKENLVVSTSGMGYGGYGRGWGRYGGGVGMSTTTASTYTEGTLIVDAYEPEEKKMVWRGTGTVTLKSKPEKVTEQINNIMTKMGAKWEKILKNQGE